VPGTSKDDPMPLATSHPGFTEAAILNEVNTLRSKLRELEDLLAAGDAHFEAGGQNFEAEMVAAATALRGQIAATLAISDADGYDLRPNPLTARTPEEFTAALRQFRLWAGKPSLRKISRLTTNPHMAPSTLCSALRSNTLPTYAVVQAVITDCGGSEEDQKRFATSWRKLRLEQETTSPHEPRGCAA
jgi:hypothetical protein